MRNPDGGLLIYQTGMNKGLYHFDGGDDTWKKVGDGPFSWTDGTGTVYTNNRVGIGNSNPNNSALLDLTSTSKGFLLPRMTTAQRDAITALSQGLKIFNTDDRCEDTYDGQKWAKNCDMKQSGILKTFGNTIHQQTLGHQLPFDLVILELKPLHFP